MKPEIVGDRVKSLMEKRNVSSIQLAEKLDITEEELKEKLTGKQEFYVSEVIIITQLFNLDIKTVAEIFFSDKIGKAETENEEKMKI